MKANYHLNIKDMKILNKKENPIKVRCFTCGEDFKIGVNRDDVVNGIFKVELECPFCSTTIKKEVRYDKQYIKVHKR